MWVGGNRNAFAIQTTPAVQTERSLLFPHEVPWERWAHRRGVMVCWLEQSAESNRVTSGERRQKRMNIALKNLLSRICLSRICVALMLVAVTSVGSMAAVTAEQREKLKALSEKTVEAGKSFADGSYLDSATKIKEVQTELLKLLETKDVSLFRLAKPIYARVAKARGLLELEGADMGAFPGWTEIVRGASPAKPAESSVSFKRDIAPWLISACGNCHIDNQRGQVSLANFTLMARGARGVKLFFPGDSKGSRLVEVIENGDMPRGGGKVSQEQLTTLKLWIDEGAKFDGPNPNVALRSFASGAPGNRTRSPNSRTPVRMATGNETVSFSKDIAPLLKENCNGCHIAGRRASGNLRMDTFAQLMRGGDSGEPIAGSNANGSLLVKKLKGLEGRRMPAGRPPLSDEQVSLISTWIREGATFDGPSENSNIDDVIGQGWAQGASHADLFAKRQERSLQMWKRVLPNDPPESAKNGEVFVVGNVSKAKLAEVLESAINALKMVQKSLRISAGEPLIKGGFTIFVLGTRYDYSEFGRMTESRELPKEWLGHWQADPIDVYAVLAAESEMKEKQADAIALQVVAGAYLGQFSEVPNWFAEGVARNLVISNFRRGDPRVKQWQASLPVAMQKVENARSLLEDRLDEEASGLVGMALANFMMSKRSRVRFDKLLELLRNGRSFPEATTFAFAPPETMVKAWLGKK